MVKQQDDMVIVSGTILDSRGEMIEEETLMRWLHADDFELVLEFRVVGGIYRLPRPIPAGVPYAVYLGERAAAPGPYTPEPGEPTQSFTDWAGAGPTLEFSGLVLCYEGSTPLPAKQYIHFYHAPGYPDGAVYGTEETTFPDGNHQGWSRLLQVGADYRVYVNRGMAKNKFYVPDPSKPTHNFRRESATISGFIRESNGSPCTTKPTVEFFAMDGSEATYPLKPNAAGSYGMVSLPAGERYKVKIAGVESQDSPTIVLPETLGIGSTSMHFKK